LQQPGTPTWTPYERATLREARRADPLRTPVAALVHLAGTTRAPTRERPFESAPGAKSLGARAREVALFASGVLAHAVDALNDVARRTLDRRAVAVRFQRAGHRSIAPERLADVRRLALWEVDEVAEGLAFRYAALAAGLGGATVAMAPAGLAFDVAAVIALAMRAIDECALIYGFDPSDPDERRFARNVLAAALTSRAEVRRASFVPVIRAGMSALRLLRVVGPVAGAVRRAAGASASRRPTRVRASAATVAAVLASGAVHAWLMVGVVRAAEAAYRERFLLESPASLRVRGGRGRAHATPTRRVLPHGANRYEGSSRENSDFPRG
jgi:hypothetical protein